MTERQLRRRVRSATLALYAHLPTHYAGDPRWRHEAFKEELTRLFRDVVALTREEVALELESGCECGEYFSDDRRCPAVHAGRLRSLSGVAPP